MDLGLKGKVAMVAGASRGLGYAVAEALAREGAIVSISSSNQTSIDEAAARLTATGATAFGAAVDVRNGDHIAAWGHETIERFGGVDLLFTNGGGPPAGAAVSFDDAAWQNAAESSRYASKINTAPPQPAISTASPVAVTPPRASGARSAGSRPSGNIRARCRCRSGSGR